MRLIDRARVKSAAAQRSSGLTRLLADRDLLATTTHRVRVLRALLEQEGAQQTAVFLRAWKLSKRLRGYRDVLAKTWSEVTCYQPSLQSLQSSTSPSFGQCGVSSAWLIPRLSWHQRLRATYCVGHVIFDDGRRGTSAAHCWVEIGSSTRRLVIDLTFDQLGHPDPRQVLCAPHQRLLDESIDYQSEGRMRFRHLRADDVWQRYKILVDATAVRRDWTAVLTRR
ncbi:hypothetical protein [Kribbella soli]|uniref:Uncharacterized protein n=1 Tax=Kribbella soli TaxID=1124743 RepID=A0A4R0H5K9_9ACTN|nr:hypothetical protein [Kribbella soli]TCC05143.1 hypothetical protein E0H45_24115 [Kribbella soli]